MTKEPQEEPKSSVSKSPSSWSAEERYRIVIEAAGVSDADLGEFLRKRGLYAAQLEEWRRLAAEGAQAALAPGKRRGRE